jgi:hypothetical protein
VGDVGVVDYQSQGFVVCKKTRFVQFVYHKPRTSSMVIMDYLLHGGTTN